MNTVFFVTALSNADDVAQRIKTVIQDEQDCYTLSDHQWFVVFDGLSRDLADKLGMRGDPCLGNGLVMPVTSYSGRAAPSLWEWLAAQMNRV